MKPYLNIGCGGHFTDDWTNIDLISHPGVIYGDITRPWPLPDGAFRMVYASHVIEHLSESEARRLLQESWRVLAPGGICRMVVPDLEDICREYIRRLEDCLQVDSPRNAERYRWATLELLDQMTRDTSGGAMREFLDGPMLDPGYVTERAGDVMIPGYAEAGSTGPRPQRQSRRQPLRLQLLRWLHKRRYKIIKRWLGPRHTREVHRWMYDRYSLNVLMDKAGFTDIEVVSHETSRLDVWKSIGLDTSFTGKGPRKPVSLYMEGVKPG